MFFRASRPYNLRWSRSRNRPIPENSWSLRNRLAEFPFLGGRQTGGLQEERGDGIGGQRLGLVGKL